MIDLNNDENDFKKSIIAGHYVFSTDEFKDIKNKFSKSTSLSPDKIDLILKSSVKDSILRYVKHFGLMS